MTNSRLNGVKFRRDCQHLLLWPNSWPFMWVIGAQPSAVDTYICDAAGENTTTVDCGVRMDMHAARHDVNINT